VVTTVAIQSRSTDIFFHSHSEPCCVDWLWANVP